MKYLHCGRAEESEHLGAVLVKWCGGHMNSEIGVSESSNIHPIAGALQAQSGTEAHVDIRGGVVTHLPLAEKAATMVGDLFDKNVSGRLIAGLVGIPKNDPQLTRYTAGESSRAELKEYCMAVASNRVFALHNEGTSQSIETMTKHFAEIERTVENAEKLGQRSLQAAVAAMNYFDEKGRTFEENEFRPYRIENELLTGVVEIRKGTSEGSAFVRAGEVISEIDGKEFSNLRAVVFEGDVPSGVAHFEKTPGIILRGSLVTEIDGEKIQDVKKFGLTEKSFNAIVNIAPKRGTDGLLTRGDLPVVEGKLVREIAGMKILHCFDFEIIDGKINGKFNLKEPITGATINRTVVGGVVQNRSWTFYENIVNPGVFGMIRSSETIKEYGKLIELPISERIALVERNFNSTRFTEIAEVCTAGGLYGAFGLAGGSVLGYFAGSAVSGLGSAILGQSAGGTLGLVMGMGVAALTAGAAALTGINDGRTDLTESPAEKTSVTIAQILALKDGGKAAEAILDRLIKLSNDPDVVRTAACVRYPEYFQYTEGKMTEHGSERCAVTLWTQSPRANLSRRDDGSGVVLESAPFAFAELPPEIGDRIKEAMKDRWKSRGRGGKSISHLDLKAGKPAAEQGGRASYWPDDNNRF